MNEIKKNIVKCPNCSYQWAFVGKSNRVKCRRCGKFFQIKYIKKPMTKKLKNKALSEKTLAFLGNDFDSVTDKKFLMDSVAIVLGDDLTKEIKEESRKIKMTEINLIRVIVKKYLKKVR